jgi:L,D-peptidoglycan transpeptidase YkuD (ErfK/YbiS/YcfS/YnhG family)
MINLFFQFLTLLPIPTSTDYGHKYSVRGGEIHLSKQIIVVVTGGWDSLQGKMICFDKLGGKWIPRFHNAVVVGKNGMGIGDGLDSTVLQKETSYVKKEGDLKSPAGIFSIGPAFGYASPKAASWIKNTYIEARETLICVDDPRSVWYNKLVSMDSLRKDWASFEQMHRKDDFYEWGLFINHNATNPKPNLGSCIFMHIWKSDHEGTVGCTAMKKTDILRLLRWINASAHPLLIQMPETEYLKLARKDGFPMVRLR